tara:strand:- start:53 stop:277 length:225 start_codon:yes stop_codon:yes gene_type:complete
MGLKDAILQKVLKVVDDTIGKKFKIIDQLTDLFQGQEGRINKLEDKVKQMERDYENQHEKESCRDLDTKTKSKR